MDCTPSCCWHVCGTLKPPTTVEHGPFMPSIPTTGGVAFVCCKCGGYESTWAQKVQEDQIEFMPGATPTSKHKEKPDAAHQR